MEYRTDCYEETLAVGESLGKTLPDGSVVALFGGLGMGKTAFVTGLARGMGISCDVSSPTFALVHEYRSDRRALIHFDMYRVDSWDSLYSTGFFDYLDTPAVLAIEWSENIDGALPEDTIEVTLSLGETEHQRRIVIEPRKGKQ